MQRTRAALAAAARARAVLERALVEEMTGHLGYEKHDRAVRGIGSSGRMVSPARPEAVQHASTATPSAETDSDRLPPGSDLSQRPPMTVMRLVHTEEIGGLASRDAPWHGSLVKRTRR